MARKLFGLAAAVALASGAMFALVGPASAQTAPNVLHVVKDVSGPVPSGTVFSVNVSCNNGDTTIVQTIWFDETGHASNSSGTQTAAPVINPRNNDTCTVAETYSGGASSIAYGCVVNDNNSTNPATTCTDPSGTDNVVHYSQNAQSDVATVTITNTFSSTTTTTTTLAPAVTTLPPATTTTVAPKPAVQPVVAPAHFTG